MTHCDYRDYRNHCAHCGGDFDDRDDRDHDEELNSVQKRRPFLLPTALS